MDTLSLNPFYIMETMLFNNLYLSSTYEEMWANWWEEKTEFEKELLKEMPNFSAEKFRHINPGNVSKD